MNYKGLPVALLACLVFVGACIRTQTISAAENPRLIFTEPRSERGDEEPAQHGLRLAISWSDRFLSIDGDFPGAPLRTHYLEAYCRSGSTHRPWQETVIPHRSELLPRSTPAVIRLRDTLDDGVTVRHEITAANDTVDFFLEAHNGTDRPSDVQWAQPCVRVDQFTGRGADDARRLVPSYVERCFLFIGGRARRLPTDPWEERALYTPGQVYCPADVPREDVNPRPLSRLLPSCSLCGCYSADGSKILAMAWEPYQEIFQGVVACLHCDFRVGGLGPGQSKKIRGRIYIVDADLSALIRRFREDFPAQASGVALQR